MSVDDEQCLHLHVQVVAVLHSILTLNSQIIWSQVIRFQMQIASILLGTKTEENERPSKAERKAKTTCAYTKLRQNKVW